MASGITAVPGCSNHLTAYLAYVSRDQTLCIYIYINIYTHTNP